MTAGRSFKPLVSRRRRADDGEEDDEGSVMVEDSQSEGSVLSDMEDDEAEVSSLGVSSAAAEKNAQDSDTAANGPRATSKKPRKARKKAGKKLRKDQQREPGTSSSQAEAGTFKVLTDTQAMLSGLKIDGNDGQEETLDFDVGPDNNGPTARVITRQTPIIAASTNGHSRSLMERQRRDHDEYKKKRDADPAFIPNRGNFFMHDTRSHGAPGTVPARGAWNGRGRGMAGANVGGPFSPTRQTAQAERAAELPWKHDLHETINEEPARAPSNKIDSPQDRNESARLFPKATGHHQAQQSRLPSFSSTRLVSKVQIRVFLSGMKSAVNFSEVPWKQYTRLPDHRPPLRRDKPVRVFLPGLSQRYIFPSTERSFIFIPRQMRPSQQGFGRNTYQRSVGGYGYSSRRTSMYGGSGYAGSVAASRRSSFASVTRENAFSPVGSFTGGMSQTRPVVRLPHGPHSQYSASSTPMGPLSGNQTPTSMQVHTYPLPQQPTFQGIATTTMYQPRPQKAISVTGIESPAAMQQASPDAQPFQNQLPAHMAEQSASFSPRQQYTYAQQSQAGTPLSRIPEQAIHAASFQPPMMPYGGPSYYGPYQAQQNYYYPPGPGSYPQMPMYGPPQQSYIMPPPPAAAPLAPTNATSQQQPPLQPTELELQHQQQQQQQPAPEQHQQSQSQSGMVAHESNGMVFYIPASEAQQQPQTENYQPAESFVPSYAMPGLPPPTPAPDAAYYYPPQMQMPPYYPSAGQQQ